MRVCRKRPVNHKQDDTHSSFYRENDRDRQQLDSLLPSPESHEGQRTLVNQNKSSVRNREENRAEYRGEG